VSCHNCNCCKLITGRLFGVSEKSDGAVLTSAIAEVAVHDFIGSGGGGVSTPVVTVTITEDAVGDSIVLAGNNLAGFVPSGIADSRGNTYHTDYVQNVDGHMTMGLDGTAWVTHGVYDVAPLKAGDTITFTLHSGLSVAPDTSSATVAALDVTGLAGTGAGIDVSQGNFAFGVHYDLTIPGTLATDHDLLVVTSGSPGDGGQDDPPTNTQFGVGRDLWVGAEVLSSNTCPTVGASPPSTPSATWGEGIAVAFKTVSNPRVFLDDTGDFDEEGGTATITNADTGVTDTITYTGIDDDTNELLGVTGLTDTFPDGSLVQPVPAGTFRFGDVQIDGEDDLIQARIPHYLYDRTPTATADLAAGEVISVLLRVDDTGWTITDIYGEEPKVDGSFILPHTLPLPSDGYAPAFSPTPDLAAGDDHIKVRWAAVETNANGDPQRDLVAYDVHVSADVDNTTADLDLGVGDGEWLLTAVTPGAAGNDITIEVFTD